MSKGIRIIYWLFILWSVLLAVLNLNANIVFGHGLGDVYYLLFLLFFVIVISIINFNKIGNTNKQVTATLLLIFMLVIVIAFTLKLTIYRGPEYPWNGRLFVN